jgi:hypothetical protein
LKYPGLGPQLETLPDVEQVFHNLQTQRIVEMLALELGTQFVGEVNDAFTRQRVRGR